MEGLILTGTAQADFLLPHILGNRLSWRARAKQRRLGSYTGRQTQGCRSPAMTSLRDKEVVLDVHQMLIDIHVLLGHLASHGQRVARVAWHAQPELHPLYLAIGPRPVRQVPPYEPSGSDIVHQNISYPGFLGKTEVVMQWIQVSTGKGPGYDGRGSDLLGQGRKTLALIDFFPIQTAIFHYCPLVL